MTKKLLLLVTLSITLFSCKNSEETSSNTTWIGGEIVNPLEDFVLFYQGDHIIDSIKLNKDNSFIYEAENLKAGLYSFSHKEFQVFYLEPKDSLMLRVNTIDFDESLSYTGKGAERNNFLIEMFLHNEAEIELMPQLYRLAPLEFEKALDSLKNIRLGIYNGYVIKHEPNTEFKEVAEASINYDYYSKKEIYITANNSKKEQENYIEIPESFYNYRKNVDFGSETLRSYFPYTRFLYRYFDNRALEENKENDFYNKNSFTHSYTKLKIIDSTITNTDLKNSMVRYIAGSYLLNCNSKENQTKMLALFQETNTNEKHIKKITEIAEASMKLTPGNEIPNLSIITAENTLKSIHGVINNPTVFYLWSGDSDKHHENIHYRVKELNSKFPEYDFIGINTDSNYNNWIHMVTKKGYNKGKEYQFEDISKAEKTLVIYSMNKTIIVDENAKIINGSANLFNKNIEGILLGYLNQ